jgi:hypothetical protein
MSLQEMIADSETSSNAVLWTQKVLDCRRKYATIVLEAFSSDRLFLQAMNQAFEVRALSAALCWPLVPASYCRLARAPFIGRQLSHGDGRLMPLQ